MLNRVLQSRKCTTVLTPSSAEAVGSDIRGLHSVTAELPSLGECCGRSPIDSVEFRAQIKALNF